MKIYKMEFSKKITLFLLCFGVLAVAMYYLCVWFEKPVADGVAIAAMSELIGSLLGYLGYQGWCKHSRNKTGIDKNGIPFKNQNNCETM